MKIWLELPLGPSTSYCFGAFCSSIPSVQASRVAPLPDTPSVAWQVYAGPWPSHCGGDDCDRSPQRRRRQLSYITAAATTATALQHFSDDYADSPYLHLHLRLLPLINRSSIALRSRLGTSSKSMGPATGTERLRISDATAKAEDYSDRSTYHHLVRTATWDSPRAAAVRRHLQRLLGHRLSSIHGVYVHTPHQVAAQIRISAHLVHAIQ